MSKPGYNRQRARRHRKRTQYPDLNPGQVATLERKECGKNVGLAVRMEDGRYLPRKVTKGVFQFTRLIPRVGRSKYNPATEDANHES